MSKPEETAQQIEQRLAPPARWLKAQLQRLWGIWSAFWFSLTGLFALSSYFLIFSSSKGRKAWLASFWVTRYWARLLRRLMLIQLHNHRVPKLKPEDAYVIVSNHRSTIDIPICMATCPIPFSFLAKIEVDRIPIIGYLARHMHICVDRKSEAARKASFQRMQEHLQKQRSVHIFVEGTRHKALDSPLGHFYDGAFRLAILSQRPLLVLTIVNSGSVMSPNAPGRVSPARVDCYWAQPIETKGLSLEDLPALKEQARRLMLQQLCPEEV